MYTIEIPLPRLTREYFSEHNGGVESSNDKYNSIDDLTDTMIEETVREVYKMLLTERDVVLDNLYDLGFHKVEEYSQYPIEYDVEGYMWIVKFDHPHPAKVLRALYETLAIVIEFITTNLYIYVEVDNE